jgi:hypothetical protein
MTSERGVVGERQLVGAQTFDISRLTTHPVAITPGKFIAVSGVGPKGDSNGSGKTSFLAAVSILLADPQWHLESNGGKFASGVLFRPDAAGLDPSLKVTPAPYGYVAAVFAEPGAPEATALTVWVRISATAPYVQARWVQGLHIADADGDEDRALQADMLWQALSPGSTISARKMAQELYGDAPRCLSYLDTDLRPSIPSLLSQQMKKMAPDEIGGALVALSGLSSQLDEEERQRGTVLGQQSKLSQAESDGVQAQAEEDAELAAVAARDAARQMLADALVSWRLYAARMYLSALTQDRLAASQLSERTDIHQEAEGEKARVTDDLERLRAAGDLTERERRARAKFDGADQSLTSRTGERSGLATRKGLLIDERNQLTPQASRWNGQPVEQAAHELAEVTDARAAARSAAISAQDSVKAAEAALEDARAGRSGHAGRLVKKLLAEKGMQAVALADVIELDDNTRDEWEPRLYGLRDAVVVPRGSRARALALLADEPGTQVISADSTDLEAPRLVSGGIRYPAGLQKLVSTLADRLAFRERPSRADDDSLGSSSLGGFTEPLVGREALIHRAVTTLESARTDHKKALRAVRTAEARWTLAEAQDGAARARERLATIATEVTGLDDQITALDTEVGELTGARTTALTEYEAARDLRISLDSQVALAEALLKEASRKEADARRKLEELRASREKLAVEPWSREFGGSQEDAAQLVEASSDGSGTRPQTLLRRAAESFSHAMRNFTAGLSDVPADLADAERRREVFAEQQPDKPVSFDAVTRPLAIRLDGYAERDRITQSRIEAQRAKREEALREARIEGGNGRQRLTTLQDMIEHIIEATLFQVSGAFNRMSTYGAVLDIVSVRPEGAAPWRWEVTPKWKRSPSGAMVSYKEAANSAQVKVFAIQLVLAALIADAETTGRVLILDELGNSLGDVNRREVLASLSAVAERQQVTILGTCQDSVLSDAADHFGELIWFTHATATDAYNQPTRVWAHDSRGERVELTAGWLQTGRAHV